MFAQRRGGSEWIQFCTKILRLLLFLGSNVAVWLAENGIKRLPLKQDLSFFVWQCPKFTRFYITGINTNSSDEQDRTGNLLKFQTSFFFDWLSLSEPTSSVTHHNLPSPASCKNTYHPSPGAFCLFSPLLPTAARDTNTQTNGISGHDVWSSALVSSPVSHLFLGTWSGVRDPAAARSFIRRQPFCRCRFVYPAVWSKPRSLDSSGLTGFQWVESHRGQMSQISRK